MTSKDSFVSSRHKTPIKDMQFVGAPKRRLDSLRSSANIRIIRRDARPTTPHTRPQRDSSQLDMTLWLPETPEPMTLRRPARYKTFLVYSAIVALALIVGVSFYFQAVGQWVIVAAGIAGIFLRINSIVYFTAALIALGIVVVMTIGGQEMMASNYAVYAYLLMAFGTFHSIINLQRPEAQLAPSR